MLGASSTVLHRIGNLLCALGLFFGVSEMAAAQVTCRTKVLHAPYASKENTSSKVYCDEDEFLLSGDQITNTGVSQCTSSLQPGTAGRTVLIGDCGMKLPWLARLTCCKGKSLDTKRLSCAMELEHAAIDGVIPESWRLSCCRKGVVVTAQSYLHPSGQGNCPVRIVETDGRQCAAVSDCGMPQNKAHWVLEKVCCTDQVKNQ